MKAGQGKFAAHHIVGTTIDIFPDLLNTFCMQFHEAGRMHLSPNQFRERFLGQL
jgi:hypothetical protein